MVKEQSIRNAIAMIRYKYANTELAEKTAQALEEYIASPTGKHCMSTDDTNTFLFELSAIINATTHDLHFEIVPAVSSGPASRAIPKAGPHYIQITRFDNFSLEQVRSEYTQVLGQMQSPVVLDLRYCGGGNIDTVHFLLSHFFPTGTPLFKVQTRDRENKTNSNKSNSNITTRTIESLDTMDIFPTFNKVRKYTGEVKILINGFTYSGGEIVAAVLQKTNRAKIYGTPTGGAFHITRYFQIDEIVLRLPYSKVIVGDKDHEGVGVIPDYDPTTKEFIDTVFTNIANNVV